MNERRDPVTISRTVEDTSTSPGPAERGDACGDVHRHSGNVRTAHLDLSGVNTGPYLDAERSDGIDDCLERSRVPRWGW